MVPPGRDVVGIKKKTQQHQCTSRHTARRSDDIVRPVLITRTYVRLSQMCNVSIQKKMYGTSNVDVSVLICPPRHLYRSLKESASLLFVLIPDPGGSGCVAHDDESTTPSTTTTIIRVPVLQTAYIRSRPSAPIHSTKKIRTNLRPLLFGIDVLFVEKPSSIFHCCCCCGVGRAPNPVPPTTLTPSPYTLPVHNNLCYGWQCRRSVPASQPTSLATCVAHTTCEYTSILYATTAVHLRTWEHSQFTAHTHILSYIQTTPKCTYTKF